MKNQELNKEIYNFKETIKWLDFEKNYAHNDTKKITKNLAANFKRQFELYDAFVDTYIPEKPGFNKHVAAYYILEALKKMIYINQKAHNILTPSIKFEPLEKQLKDDLDSKPEIKKFIIENWRGKIE